MAGEPTNLLDIHALRVQRQVADLHILDHATAKRAHRQLLCETDSATWRHRIVAQRSRQTMEKWSMVATKQTLSSWGNVDHTKELPRSGLVQSSLSRRRIHPAIVTTVAHKRLSW
jgi:hypothetical protein